MLWKQGMKNSSFLTHPQSDNGDKIKMNSCSGIEAQQFLLFRAVWPVSTKANVLFKQWNTPEALPWIKEKYKKAAKRELTGKSYIAKCWRAYLDELKNRKAEIEKLEEMGIFAIPRLSLEEYNLKQDEFRKSQAAAEGSCTMSLRFTAQRPQTPTPEVTYDNLPDLTSAVRNIQLDPRSPARGDWIPREEAEYVKEQIFNSICTEIFKAITSLIRGVKEKWFVNGTKFQVAFKGENVFSGTVDGALYSPEYNVYIAIVETKRMPRYYNTSITNQIKRQESGEMVAWIHEDAPNIEINDNENKTF